MLDGIVVVSLGQMVVAVAAAKPSEAMSVVALITGPVFWTTGIDVDTLSIFVDAAQASDVEALRRDRSAPVANLKTDIQGAPRTACKPQSAHTRSCSRSLFESH